MRQIDESIEPFCLNGMYGICHCFNQNLLSLSKFKNSEWWMTPVIILDTWHSNKSVVDQLSGDNLKEVFVDVDGYKAKAIEITLNGNNTFVFKASDYPAISGRRLRFYKPQMKS